MPHSAGFTRTVRGHVLQLGGRERNHNEHGKAEAAQRAPAGV